MYKFLFVTTIMFFFGVLTNAQHFVKYDYDASGNRTMRKLITIPLAAPLKNEKVKDPEPIIEELGERKVTIFPNPTKGQLKIDISGGKDEADYQFSLYNASGALIFSGQILQRGQTPLNMDSFENGIYILILNESVNNEKLTFKIIKQ